MTLNNGVTIPLVVVTLFWTVIGAGVPWFVPRGSNRGVIQTIIVLVAVCCYIFWLLCFLHQLNPLIGPELSQLTIMYLNETWGYAGQ